MITVAFVHNKGGTGKTTACLNIAGWLAKAGQKVLVADLDPQGNATSGLGVDRQSLDSTLFEVMNSALPLEECIYETASGIYLASSSIDLMTLEGCWNGNRESLLPFRQRLAEVEEYFDFAFIDLPPGLLQLMVSGMVAAENLIVPVDSGVFAYEALQTLKEFVLELQDGLDMEFSLLAVLVRENGPLGFRGPTGEIIDKTREFLAESGLRDVDICRIPFSAKVWKGQMEGMPISHYAPGSGAGKAFRRVAEALLTASRPREGEADSQ